MLSYQFTDIVICLLSSLLKYAAARINDGNLIVITVSTRSRAEAAATKHLNLQWQEAVSTHSRAEAAAEMLSDFAKLDKCFNTQPRGGGCLSHFLTSLYTVKFQHTAARRRLRWFSYFK